MKPLKKLIALALSVIMLCSCFSVLVFAEDEKAYVADYDTETPVILIHGMGQNNTYLLNEEGERITQGGNPVTGWPLTLDIPALIKNILPGLFKSIFTRKDSGLYDGLYNGAIDSLYAIEKDAKGNYVNKVETVFYPYSFAEMSEEEKETCYEQIPVKELTEIIGEENVFYFGYDTFGNVSETAEIFHDFLNNIVLKKTGAKQATICTISLGGTITVEHLEKYPEDRALIKKMLFFISAIDGSDIVGDLLTDNLSVFYDDETLYNDLMVTLLGDSYLAYLLNMVLRILPSDVLKSGLRGLVHGVVQAIIRSCTQMWALCPDEYYAAAREKWLADEEYSEIRAQVDSFMKSRANFEKNLNALKANGTELYNIVCYDAELFPLSKDYKKTNSDGIIDAASTSMGMNFADLGTTFSEGYKAKGTYCSNPAHNHLSPENDVDPTTGLLPCSTWFFKGQLHERIANNDVAIKLSIQLLSDKNMHDVYSNPASYPQYNSYRLTKKANANIELWNETEKKFIPKSKIRAVENAIGRIREIEEETVIDSAKWLAAEKALNDALISAGIIKSEEPSAIENGLTALTKMANRAVNEFYKFIPEKL